MIGNSVIHYGRVLAGLDRPQTQTTAAEREVLASFLLGAARIVEIGVFEGFTTRLLAERADPGAVIYGVDPFFSGRLGISWGEFIARNYNRGHLASGRVRFVAKLSTEVADDVPSPVDLVFIDGDHSPLRDSCRVQRVRQLRQRLTDSSYDRSAEHPSNIRAEIESAWGSA